MGTLEIKKSGTSMNDIGALVVYGLTNALLVYKYTSRITVHPGMASLLYLVLASSFMLLLYRRTEFRVGPPTQTLIYFSFVVFLAILLTSLMLHFDPGKIRVGRYPAMHDWISRLLDSEFPYASPTRPSGFPFLFAMAMPFYLVGDLGLLQIFSFLIFAFLVHLRYRQQRTNEFRCLLLLVSAPIFLYEVIVRSDLFSNMVLLMLYLAVFEMFGQRAGRITLCLLGVLGGLLLSTRGIALLVYIPILGHLLKKPVINCGLFLLSVSAGFLLSLVPFAVWDWSYFTRLGPLSIQLSYVSNWLLVLALACSIGCAAMIRTLKRAYSCVAFTLFGVICVSFIMSVLHFGWHRTVAGDRFDISYFCLALPFLLISLDFPGNERVSRNGMFAIRPIA